MEAVEGKMDKFFANWATKASKVMGSPWAFILAVILIAGWALSGPFFDYSEVWQLVINTSTTIITFLMVFLIQNTQNRESRALHLKLDEILLATSDASNEMVDIEELSGEELEQIANRIKEAKSQGCSLNAAKIVAEALPRKRLRVRKTQRSKAGGVADAAH
jgi:low affinity Fe/Cu permease